MSSAGLAPKRRSVFIGLSASASHRRVARRAGMIDARKTTTIKPAAAAAHKAGSNLSTPTRRLSIARTKASAPPRPNSRPATATPVVRRSTSRTIIDGVAPSAKRTPNSRSRCATLKATTPYSPTAASSSRRSQVHSSGVRAQSHSESSRSSSSPNGICVAKPGGSTRNVVTPVGLNPSGTFNRWRIEPASSSALTSNLFKVEHQIRLEISSSS